MRVRNIEVFKNHQLYFFITKPASMDKQVIIRVGPKILGV